MSDDGANFKVLVVDDDASIRQAIKPLLEGAGYSVTLAANGQEALACFVAGRFDLLILDLNLPRIGGWDVFEHLTTRDPFMAVIVITGMPNQFRTASAAGVGTLMEKPIDAPALLKIMARLFAEPKEKHLLRLRGDLNDTRHFQPGNSPQLNCPEDP